MMRRGQKNFYFTYQGMLVEVDSLTVAVNIMEKGWREITRAAYRREKRRYIPDAVR